MKAYTIRDGSCAPGIALTSDPNGRPVVKVGEGGRGRKLVLVPVPHGATIEGRTAGVQCPNVGRPAFEILTPEDEKNPSSWGRCPVCNAGVDRGQTHRVSWLTEPGDGRLTEAPSSRGDEDALSALILVTDHSGYRGAWSPRKARPDAEWDDRLRREKETSTSSGWLTDDQAPTWRVIAQGECAQGGAGRMGGGPEYLTVLRDGEAFEVVRTGRLYGAPAVFRVANSGGAVTVTVPRAAAEQRAAVAAW